MQLPGPDYAAPAKLNLCLRIVGRRADGYHLLQSLFVLIDRGDRVRLRVREDGEITRVSELAGVPAEADLAIRAAQALKSAARTPLGADIEIEKHIPIGGGLGGGSSDAATVLWVLNRLWRTNLPKSELQTVGLALGADVPFFLYGRNAWVEGIGERFSPVADAQGWCVVLTPGVEVPTKQAFSAPELTRNQQPIIIKDFSAPGAEALGNALESVVFARYPKVGEYHAWLAQHVQQGSPARMSGSGSSVFARFASERDALRVLAARPAEMAGFVARVLERHPLAVE